jgi:predicted ABC-type ATPase
VVIPALAADLFDTSQKYADQNGRYTPARVIVHNNIIKNYLQKMVRIKSRKTPNAIFMAGGSGAGKSTALNKLAEKGVLILPDYVIINSDDIKEMIPEYNQFKKVDSGKAADLVHKESSYLSDKVLDQAKMRKSSFILDGTFSWVEDSKKQLQNLPGYQTKIIYVDAPIEVALKRVKARGDATGRYVPDDYVRSSNDRIRKNIDELTKFATNTFFILSSDSITLKKITWQNGKYKIVNRSVDLLTPDQVKEFKSILDP